MLSAELREGLDRAHIAVARRPVGLRNGANVTPLPQRLWPDLLAQLEAEYRRATGEENAVLIVQNPNKS